MSQPRTRLLFNGQQREALAGPGLVAGDITTMPTWPGWWVVVLSVGRSTCELKSGGNTGNSVTTPCKPVP